VDTAKAVVGDCVEVIVYEVKNVEPSEVTNKFVVITVGGGVFTTGISVIVDDDVSVEVGEGENEGVGESVGVGVGIGGVDEDDDDIGVDEQNDPKKVVNTVTGTSTVSVAGTVTVEVSPGRVINDVENVGIHGEDDPNTQVLITTVDTEPGAVETNWENVVTKLPEVLTCVAVKVGKSTQEAIFLKSGY